MSVGGDVVWFIQRSGGDDGADDDQALVVHLPAGSGRIMFGIP